MNTSRLVKFVEIGLIAGGGLGVLVCVMFLGWYGFFSGKVMPGVRVAGVELGGKTRDEAERVLVSAIEDRGKEVVFIYGVRSWGYGWESMGIVENVEGSVEKALLVGRGGWWGPRDAVRALVGGRDMELDYREDEEVLAGVLDTLAAELFIPEVESELVWLGDEGGLSGDEGQGDLGGEEGNLVDSGGSEGVVLVEGVEGREVDTGELEQRVKAAIANLSNSVVVPVKATGLKLTEDQKAAAIDRAEKWGDKKLELKIDILDDEKTSRWEWERDKVWGLWDWEGGWDEGKLAREVGRLADEVRVEPQDALFQFDESKGKVTEFESSREGQELDRQEAAELLVLELSNLESSEAMIVAVKLPVFKVEPEIGLEDVNKLGINELIGRGKSVFKGSIATRIHNIGLAASRLNGVLVKPGAVFSFNASLGEVSAATGYQQAYVIRSGRTELDDGGGVCQVSTTFFRAILDAGLPVMERHAHSYRVGYYEQDAKPGLDATVFAPRVDLKFENDTPAYILVQSKFDRSKMTLEFDLYGTSDGRDAELGTPRVWEVTEPPEDVYQDDPSLPAGEVKQIEYKAWGAKAAFDWRVTRGDEVLRERTFYSSYKPWGAVYLRGVAPQ